MEITHQDSRGNLWRFGIDCTPAEFEQIRGMLARVRAMGTGGPRPLSLSAISEDRKRETVGREIEAALLAGLLQRFPAPGTPANGYIFPPQRNQPETNQQPTRKQPQNNPGTTPKQPQPTAADETEQEPAPRYWWIDL